MNNCLLQAFEWHSPGDGKHYQRLTKAVPLYWDLGINNIWLPPACKAVNPQGNGYDIYDLYDIGEFDQKGSVATKWGSKRDLGSLHIKASELGVGLIFDAVLSHKAGADRQEHCFGVEVEEEDRNKWIGEGKEIDAWLGFDFAGRNGEYSKHTYGWEHFNGTGIYDDETKKEAIYKILGPSKDWAQDVDMSKGNFDFLMFANLDYSNNDVRKDVKYWGSWITKQYNLRGFRIDAAKHISRDFVDDWIEYLNDVCRQYKPLFFCEYWDKSVPKLCEYLDQINAKISIYDPPLMYNFSKMSQTEKADLRTVFNDTLVQERPESAITFVANHDTQPGQTSEAPVAPWFKPLAYALILLRQEGHPCVFYGDLYGINGPEPHGPTCGRKLPHMILARKLYAYGKQRDYFFSANCIGWTREGTKDRRDGVAVLMSNAGPGKKRMDVGFKHGGEIWMDVTENVKEEVKINWLGFGVFTCKEKSVSVFLKKDEASVEDFGKM